VRGAALTALEREGISRGIAEGLSGPRIASRLGRDRSVVYREIVRCGGRENYCAVEAQERAQALAARPKPRRLAASARLHDAVNEGLGKKWSPEQIANRLRIDHPDDPEMRVSPETIYQTLYLQARGELKTELMIVLRSGRVRRRPAGSLSPVSQAIPGMVNISERPPEAADRAVPGHLEGDLIIGKGGKSQIATLVDRATRYTTLVKIPYDRTADRVAIQLGQKIRTLPADLIRSLTWDQGREMAAHAKFTLATSVPVYFADPHSPWQRPTNENTNGLLRQYFPKSTDLSGFSQTELDAVAVELNGRPRKVLGWKTPAEAYNEANNLVESVPAVH
jgi:IS30 family transposase